MVFLRLTVKIYPREQLQSTSSFSFRSILGDRSSDRDDASRNSSGATSGKPANFLIVLEKPDDVTLGGLAGMIQDKWRKLRPNAEPLDIKKLLDDDHETDDLDADMTVADVFVDNGLSQRDTRDQRATVRVIQKPTPYAPARFPSVSLDWDAAAQDYDRQIKTKKETAATSVHKFPPIAEEESQGGSVAESQSSTGRQDGSSPPRTSTESADPERRREMPVRSVEKEHVIPGSPLRWSEQSHVHEEDSQDHNQTVAATPQHRRMESQELGDSPTPTRPFASRSQGPTSMSQPCNSAPRRRSANRTINRIESESKSPPPGQKERVNGLQIPPGRQKTRSVPQNLSKENQDHEDENQNESDEGERETEDDSDRESDDDEEQEEEEEEEKEEEGEEDDDDGEQGEDGDVAMEDSDAAVAAGGKQRQQASDTNGVASIKHDEKDSRNGDLPESRLGKRKKSQENLQANKEPRLDQAGSPVEIERRSSSPSAMRKRERAPSFSGPGRRPSISEQQSPPGSLGLGITRSPPRKQSGKLDLPPSSQMSVSATPLFSSSAPAARHNSLTQENSTPSKDQTSMDKVKSLHSALRRYSPAEKSSGRSVSFAEGDKVIPLDSGPKSRSTPHPAVKKPKIMPGDKTSVGRTVYPGSISVEDIKQIEEAVAMKQEQRKEYQRKIKQAEEQNADPKHVHVLRDMYKTWEYLSGDSGRQKTADQITRAQKKMADLGKELEEFEAKTKDPPKKPEGQDTPKATGKKTRRTHANGSVNQTDVDGHENTPKQATEAPSAPAPSSSTKGSAKKTNTGCDNAAKQITPKQPTSEPAPSSSAKDPGKQTTPKQTTPAPPPASNGKVPAKKSMPKQAAPKSTTPAPALSCAKGAAKQSSAGGRESTPPATLTNGDIASVSKYGADDPAETNSHSQKTPSPAEKAQNDHPTPVSSVRTRSSSQAAKATTNTDNEPEAQPEQEPQPQPGPEPALQPEPEPSQPEPKPQPQPEPQQQEQLSPVEQSQQPEQFQESQESQKEQPRNSLMSDDVKLPEMQTIRSLDQTKNPNQATTNPGPKPSQAQEPAEESSSEEEESSSSSGSESEDDSDDSEDSEDGGDEGSERSESAKADLLQRANGGSLARNTLARSSAPPQSQPQPQSRFSSPFQRSRTQTPSQSQPQVQSQSQPQLQRNPLPHTQPFRSVNRSMSSQAARHSLSDLKSLMNTQKQEHDARVQKARQESARKKDIFDPPSDSESEDESDSDSESNSSADEGDIQSSGTVGKLRHAMRKK